MTGLADCNNFFVSCERSRNHSLDGKAVVVLSNNDGCVVARSNEAKALGIKMGQPAFEIRELTDSGRVIALSGNHLLYREISLQVHDIFRRYVPSTLDYSVDEAFLNVDGIPPGALLQIGLEIRKACLREAGIPVTIGFGRSKTLAKIVTEVCKKKREPVGMLSDTEATERLLDTLEIRDLWGIGRRLAKRLYQSGVYTIGDFYRADRHRIRRMLGINGEKSWMELHGLPCIELAHVERELQQSISETRTFPYDVDDYDYLRARMAVYAAHCSQRLRAMKGKCSTVTAFLVTNRFHTANGFHAPEVTLRLTRPANDTPTIAAAAVEGLNRIFDTSLAYKRAGIVLGEIVAENSVMPSLFDEAQPAREAAGRKLMQVIDRLNSETGHPQLRLASQITISHKGYDDGYSISFGAERR